jgi:molybdenum cofactor cytidylyltransferase
LSSQPHIGIIILAAGSSSRLGRPKQLLEFNGITLLSHTTAEAANSKADSVVVVLGARADLIASGIDREIVYIVKNKNWDEGMASSVRLGLKTLLNQTPSLDAVIFMVCDQPFVSASLLNDLINTYKESGKRIVACNYGETTGPPALFHKSFFAELMQLKGDAGAKKIIQQHSDEVATVVFPKGKIDIDSIEDYEKLVKA